MYFEIYDEPPSSGILGLPGLMQSKDIEWRWRLKGNNHETVASGESYKNRADCEKVMRDIIGLSSATEVLDKTNNRKYQL